MGLTIDDVRAGAKWQRDLCDRNGSPTYVALIDGLLARLGSDAPLTGLLTGDGQDPIRSALCLRLFGAVNRVALAESAGWLTAYYPIFGGTTDVDAVVPAFFDFLAEHLEQVRAELPVGVQTNEVGRAAALSAAMSYVAGLTGHPLRLLEVGASAGLNLRMDLGEIEVVERRGCDLNPIDVSAPGAADLLRSFVWPEHVDRIRRLDAALAAARDTAPVPVDAADATTWVRDHAPDPVDGRTTVIFHSIVLPYFTPAERERFAATIRGYGAAADSDRPLAWVGFEPTDTDSGVIELTCELWPDHRRVRLAHATAHGADLRWDPQHLPG